MRLLVTVGTTSFDVLLLEVLSPDTLGRIVSRNSIRHVTLQYGPLSRLHQQQDTVVRCIRHALKHLRPLSISFVREVPDFVPWLGRFDYVLCHGGAGTIIELVSVQKCFVAVANPALRDNHQLDLLAALSKVGVLKMCTLK